jgi:hypothetical protein
VISVVADGGSSSAVNVSSLALRADGGPVIAWIEAGGAVRLSERGADGGFQTRELTSGSVYGSQISVVIDAAGDAHVFYAEASSLTAPRRLREHIARGDAGDGLLTVDSTVDVRGYPSAAIDADGALVVTYADDTNQALRFARRVPPASTWTVATVDPPPGNAAQVGTWSSLALAPSGVLAATYGEVVNHTLKYAERGGDGGWALSTLLSSGYSSDSSALAFAADGTAVVAAIRSGTLVMLERRLGQGWTQQQTFAASQSRVGLGIQPDGGVHVAHLQSGSILHELKIAGAWRAQPLARGAGAGVTLRVDTAGGLHLAWTDNATNTVNYARATCW